MTQTAGKLQVYDVVPIGFPNAGKSAYRDATQAEIEAGLAVFNPELVRATKKIQQNATATSTINSQSARTFVFKMDANITNLGITAGQFDGQFLLLMFDQDATGSRALTFAANTVEGSYDVGIPNLYGTPNSRDIIPLTWNANTNRWSLLPNIRRIP